MTNIGKIPKYFSPSKFLWKSFESNVLKLVCQFDGKFCKCTSRRKKDMDIPHISL